MIDSTPRYDALALYSGGLDSILACKVVEAQGKRVLALHFVSPFFGKPQALAQWRQTYGLDILPVDVGEEYVRELLTSPRRGYGKYLNPCVDCHAFMVRKAMELLPTYGARFIISGEVVGQRPMSQRRDAMDCVRNDAGAEDVLLRPLCAKALPETAVERRGLIDRERLHGITGRGRTAQYALAASLGIAKEHIPASAGGCRLTEPIPAARYLKVLEALERPAAEDFSLCNHGRVLWAGRHFLAVGRSRENNEALDALAGPEDLRIQARDVPGPLGIGRQFPGEPWDEAAVASAAAQVAAFTPRIRDAGWSEANPAAMLVRQGEAGRIVTVTPAQAAAWAEPRWEALRGVKERFLG